MKFADLLSTWEVKAERTEDAKERRSEGISNVPLRKYPISS